MMMWGNAVGIPWSGLLSRLRGAPHPRSSLGYEVGTIVGDTVVMPAAVIHAAVSWLHAKPLFGLEAGHRLVARGPLAGEWLTGQLS